MASYSRSERIFFHIVDFGLNAASTLLLGLVYLALAFALFGGVTATYAWIGYHDDTLRDQFLRFGAIMIYYCAVPAMVLTCLAILLQQGWRVVWQAQSVFVEKQMHPALVVLLFIACGLLTYAANDSIGGRWRSLPARVAEFMQVRPDIAIEIIRSPGLLHPDARPSAVPHASPMPRATREARHDRHATVGEQPTRDM